MADENKLAQALNIMEMNGTVSEYNIFVKESKKNCEIDGEEKNITSAMIYGKIVAEINGESYEFSLSALDLGKHTKKGDENKAFKGILTNLGYEYSYDQTKNKVVYNRVIEDKIIPKINGTITFLYLDGSSEKVEIENGGRVATRINGKGRMSLKEGLNKDQTDLALFKELVIKFISTDPSKVGEDKCSFVIDGFVYSLVDEMNNEGKSTGRVLTTIIVPNFFGIDSFDHFVVPKEWEIENEDGEKVKVTSGQFKTFAKIGSSIRFVGDVDIRSIGGKQQVSTGHFGAQSNVTSGFKAQDWSIKGGDTMKEPFDKKLVGEAYKQHQIVLDDHFKKRKADYIESQKKKESKPQSQKGLGRSGNNSSFGSKPKVNDIKDPFGEEESKEGFMNIPDGIDEELPF